MMDPTALRFRSGEASSRHLAITIVGLVDEVRRYRREPHWSMLAAGDAMLKPWHKDDAFGALKTRGWAGPSPLAAPSDWHYVGEAWTFVLHSERCRSAFRTDGDHDSKLMPITIPK